MANDRIKIKGVCGMRYNFALIFAISFWVYGLSFTGVAEDLKKESIYSGPK